MIIYPMDKKSFVEVQKFEYQHSEVYRRVVWRYGELIVDPNSCEVQLDHCFDKSHVESDDHNLSDQFCRSESELDIINKLSLMGYKMVDSWYEINGRFSVRL